MNDRSRILAANLARLRLRKRPKLLLPPLASDGIVSALLADLAAGRAAAGMTQQEVAAHMGTTKNVISRLECGRTRPTLSTIERYAYAVGAAVEIRVRSRRKPR